MLPSESEIGRELGASQGTVRKALDMLARDRLVVRRQGKGTFVVEHTPEDVLFRFFQIYADDGARILRAASAPRRRSARRTARSGSGSASTGALGLSASRGFGCATGGRSSPSGSC